MEITTGKLQDAHVDVIALAVTGDDALEAFLASERSGEIGGKTLRRYASERLFSGDPGTVLEWPLPEEFHASVLLLVGCGTDATAERVRQAFGAAGRKARNIASGRIGIIADGMMASCWDMPLRGRCSVAGCSGGVLGSCAARRSRRRWRSGSLLRTVWTPRHPQGSSERSVS